MGREPLANPLTPHPSEGVGAMDYCTLFRYFCYNKFCQ